ncbi:BTAD domain-containing putative transcriptional regulator [Streptomyces sp. NBC_00102]|uniref:BTAD domain-containing putative transcriptional regulator n=1 Tax=Streptomyces sp. NBC_00102 TaxID=2975652 RepID=UPI0022591E8C|nr:BTAD domain-containing putative transcriptional regulator [Streptomyces sp. NBC_00102]MCX5400472.1 AAA family ATPase [Streptomyces sp. NBC_00102]
MEFRLLGPLEVQRGTEILDLGPPKRRALLLRLLLENGLTVGVDRLCDDLWNGRPPPSAVSSVHAHISRLRMVLEPGRARQEQAKVLRSVPTGYALRLPPEMLDSVQFERALQQAHALAAGGRVGEARQETERALGLWRGTPLMDASHQRFVEGEVSRLEELKLSAEELLTTLLLQEGQIAQAIIGAERLVERDPLREASWAMLMRALYFAGRHAEALQRYETVRTLLARDLGLDPGPALRETQMAILRHDTVVLRPPVRSQALGTQRFAAELPPVGWTLPGREDELGRLSAMLREAAGGHTGWAVLSGEPGIGKTRVAEELAQRAAASGAIVLRTRCAVDGLPGSGIAERQLRLLTETLERLAEGGESPRPTLCVVEDIDLASADVRGLLSVHARTLRDAPLAMLCTVTDDPGPVTERFLAELAACGAEQLRLDPLTEDDVRRVVLAADGDADSGDVTHRFHELSGGNPFLLTQLLKQPVGPRAGAVPLAVRSVVRTRLADLSPAARQVIDAAAVLGGRPDMTLVSQLTGLPVDQVLELADQAVTARLLTWRGETSHEEPGGYRFPAGLLLQGVLAELSPARSQSLHAAAAKLLAARTGWHGAEAAAHALMAGPALRPEETEARSR